MISLPSHHLQNTHTQIRQLKRKRPSHRRSQRLYRLLHHIRPNIVERVRIRRSQQRQRCRRPRAHFGKRHIHRYRRCAVIHGRLEDVRAGDVVRARDPVDGAEGAVGSGKRGSYTGTGKELRIRY